VFLNLLLNAEQAILEMRPQGLIVIRTHLRADGGAVCAEVIDDGPGVPLEAQSRIFEPFFTTKSPGSGTGLGLSVSYGIIEEHGGRLSVQSRPGETIFALELPATRPPAATEQAARPAAVASGTGRLALVVEDEPHVLDLIVTLLKEQGWKVDVAPGGRTGLQSAKQRRYDLIISDIKMPDGDGQTFFRDVKAHDATLARRFIFITGDTANPEAWAFLEDSHVPVIEKPFPPAVFEEAVARVMSAATASS
jgi:CheY-like chemotaxis protein